MEGRNGRREELQHALNRVTVVVGVLAAFASAVVSATSGGWGEGATAGLLVLLLVLVVGGFGAACAIRALAPDDGRR